MQLSSRIVIERAPQQVWEFLGDPANVAKWDRGVAAVEEHSAASRGVGFEFDTLAHDRLNLPERGRMSYRISEVDAKAGRCVVELTSRRGNARFFTKAEWQFEIAPFDSVSLLTCTAIFNLHARYLVLTPIFYLKRNAILLDLTLLKKAVEAHSN